MNELDFFAMLVNGMCWQFWQDYWAVAFLWFAIGVIIGEIHGFICGRAHERTKRNENEREN